MMQNNSPLKKVACSMFVDYTFLTALLLTNLSGLFSEIVGVANIYLNLLFGFVFSHSYDELCLYIGMS